MNLGDAELELIDPTPDVHCLFVHFDKLFFWAKLASRAAVRWSKRMYSCAGICSYDTGGLCDIALSEPLLKLRPRKDLIETLLHEMIHAYLFVMCQDQDRDGHGPNFKAHMYRINKAAGINISIYHDFHDEVQLYQTHWWRCNGPCQTWRPHFGIVRRNCNKPPGPSDHWWRCHMHNCGGTFIKIKEPEKKEKKNTKSAPKKPNADITKYINTQKTINAPKNVPAKPVLKDSNNIPIRTKSNGGSTLVITKKDPVYNPQSVKNPPLVKSASVFSGNGHVIDNNRRKSISDVTETVRNVWANKQVTASPLVSNHVLDITNTVRNIWANKQLSTSPNIVNKNELKNKSLISNPNKHKSATNIKSPPAKIKKIDEYFKTTASKVFKDLYGEDIKVEQSDKKEKLVAVVSKPDTTKMISVPNIDVPVPKPIVMNFVSCPICNVEVPDKEINKHLDVCLNKDIVEKLSKENELLISEPKTSSQSNSENNSTIVGTNTPIAKEIHNENKVVKSENFIEPKEESDLGYLPPFFDEVANEIKNPPIKVEPGTSNGTVSELSGQTCACCGQKVHKPIEEHLDECLMFFQNNNTIPGEGASTSFANETIVIDDDDDICDETMTMNATGTKLPCPCCLEMIEELEMNVHLDQCLT